MNKTCTEKIERLPKSFRYFRIIFLIISDLCLLVGYSLIECKLKNITEVCVCVCMCVHMCKNMKTS